jgi:hypothetical protein
MTQGRTSMTSHADVDVAVIAEPRITDEDLAEVTRESRPTQVSCIPLVC